MKTLFMLLALFSGAANAAGTQAGPQPTDYDIIQDSSIQSIHDFNNDQQGIIMKNRNDIDALKNDTQRQFDQVNNYVDSVQQQSNDHDAAQDTAIAALQNVPTPKDGAQGLKGDKGDKGDTGAQGVAGHDGVDGHDGITTLRTFHSVDTATQSMVSHDSLRIDALERQQKVTDRKIDQNHKEAMHGVASAMAMTGLHYTNDDNSVAIGAGEYASSGAAAMGYRHQFSSHMAAALQASWDGENSGVAGSVAVGW